MGHLREQTSLIPAVGLNGRSMDAQWSSLYYRSTCVKLTRRACVPAHVRAKSFEDLLPSWYCTQYTYLDPRAWDEHVSCMHFLPIHLSI